MRTIALPALAVFASLLLAGCGGYPYVKVQGATAIPEGPGTG